MIPLVIEPSTRNEQWTQVAQRAQGLGDVVGVCTTCKHFVDTVDKDYE
jgi:hypothetical protein